MENYNDLKKGSKVFFLDEKQGMTIKAINNRYAIVTKPFNAKRTVIYSMLDFQEEIKAPNNMVFNNYDYAKQEDIDQCLKDLEDGVIELSQRRKAPLNIDWQKTSLKNK